MAEKEPAHQQRAIANNVNNAANNHQSVDWPRGDSGRHRDGMLNTHTHDHRGNKHNAHSVRPVLSSGDSGIRNLNMQTRAGGGTSRCTKLTASRTSLR
jgi:hypothetical protein